MHHWSQSVVGSNNCLCPHCKYLPLTFNLRLTALITGLRLIPTQKVIIIM